LTYEKERNLEVRHSDDHQCADGYRYSTGSNIVYELASPQPLPKGRGFINSLSYVKYYFDCDPLFGSEAWTAE
jgi:hypothetical protein